MKKIIAILLSLITIGSFGIGTSVKASAEEANVLQPEETSLKTDLLRTEENLQNDIAKISMELESNDTDVLSELNKQLMYYQKFYLSTNNTEDKEKASRLIETTQELIDEYTLYASSIQTNSTPHSTYSTAVGALIAAFNKRGYKLAAELLTHARDNDELDSIYEPLNKDIIPKSPIFTNIVNGSSTYGTTVFPLQGEIVEQDLYYSIHWCYYSKSNSGRAVVIQDRYDYAKGEYDSFEGVIIDLMYEAQNAGVIVPFFSVITFDYTDKPARNQTGTIHMYDITRYSESQVTLGKGEYKEFETTFGTSGYKVIQTFGDKDTYISVYDAYGELLASDDDSGYNDNAFIHAYFDAHTKYIIRVQFLRSNRSGALKLVIIPSVNVTKDDKIFSSYEDTINMSSAGYIYSTYVTQGNVGYCTITPSSRNSYTIEAESSIGTCMYLLDPRSTYYYVSSSVENEDMPCLFDDGSGPNGNAIISRQLSNNIPYMIIYSRYYVNENGTLDITIKVS